VKSSSLNSNRLYAPRNADKIHKPSDASESSAVEEDLFNLIWRAAFSTAAPGKTQTRRANTQRSAREIMTHPTRVTHQA
jgi:hypothetical protein